MLDMSASSRKRARCLSIEDLDVEEISVGGEDGMPVISHGEEPEEDEENDVTPKVPRGFLCPLTLETMFDPVLDAEGNTYERYAILEWLKEHRTSPISRQHLSERMLKPNNSLREAIHEFMGTAWVQNMTTEQKMTSTKRSLFRHQRSRGMSSIEGGGAAAPQLESSSSHSREKIDCFLQFTSQKIGGLELRLNSQGCCAFQYDGITVVLDVPIKAGVFCLYTRNLVTDLTDAMKDLLLELNFLQGDTRGGCLSVKKHEDGRRAEVIFSYTDRVAEVCAQDFLNIILNFVETAVSLRRKLLATAVQVQQQQQHPQPAATTNNDLFASSSPSSSSLSSSKSTTTTTAAAAAAPPIARTAECGDNSSNKTAEKSSSSLHNRTCMSPTPV